MGRSWTFGLFPSVKISNNTNFVFSLTLQGNFAYYTKLENTDEQTEGNRK
jgi:hypothetical protein